MSECEHDYEPDTTMSYMRCSKCGARPTASAAERERAAEAWVKMAYEDKYKMYTEHDAFCAGWDRALAESAERVRELEDALIAAEEEIRQMRFSHTHSTLATNPPQNGCMWDAANIVARHRAAIRSGRGESGATKK